MVNGLREEGLHSQFTVPAYGLVLVGDREGWGKQPDRNKVPIMCLAQSEALLNRFSQLMWPIASPTLAHDALQPLGPTLTQGQRQKTDHYHCHFGGEEGDSKRYSVQTISQVG